MMAFANYLQTLKDNEVATFDKLSHSDFAVAAAFTAITEAGGPVMLNEYAYGRQDASVNECGSTEIPSGSSLVQFYESNGFSEQEIVALASIEAFGDVRNPESMKLSSHPRLDSYYFQQLLTSGQDLPLKDALVNSTTLRPHVENFAENKKEYHASLKSGFVKLCDLGSTHEQLIDVDYFLEDDTNYALNWKAY